MVSSWDTQGHFVYNSSGYEILSVNGDRTTALVELIAKLQSEETNPSPSQIFLVSSDVHFVSLARQMADNMKANFMVWVPQDLISSELESAAGYCKLLKEVLENWPVKKDVYPVLANKVQKPRPSKNRATNTFGVIRIDLVGWRNCILRCIISKILHSLN